MNSDLQLNNQQSSLRVFTEVDYNELRQVTRIAAVLYDVANNEEVAVFDQKIGDEGGSFPAVMRDFSRFCNSHAIWTFSDSEQILEENCRYNSYEFPFGQPFVRVKALLPGWGIKPSKYDAGNLYASAGLPGVAGAGALHDARSVAAAVGFFENVGLL